MPKSPAVGPPLQPHQASQDDGVRHGHLAIGVDGLVVDEAAVELEGAVEDERVLRVVRVDLKLDAAVAPILASALRNRS